VKCELAAYQAACKRWPREAITLRQGGHIIEDNQPTRDPPRQGRSCGRLGAGVGSDCASQFPQSRFRRLSGARREYLAQPIERRIQLFIPTSP
jgi:hypothetical protein